MSEGQIRGLRSLTDYPYPACEGPAPWKSYDNIVPVKFRAVTVVNIGQAAALAKTLPRNLRHFGESLVVTDPRDADSIAICKKHKTRHCVTSKEKDLDVMIDWHLGRSGWMCVWGPIFPIAMPDVELSKQRLYASGGVLLFHADAEPLPRNGLHLLPWFVEGKPFVDYWPSSHRLPLPFDVHYQTGF